MTASPAATLAVTHAVLPLVRERVGKGEADRRLPDDVVAALVQAGLMRLVVPTAYGGPEVDPLTLLDVIETVAEADGATGWCVMIASTTASLSWYLEPDWAKTVFGDPSAVAGGVVAPHGTARRVTGGWTVTGRWPWGSGTQHCRWIAGGSRADRASST
jgi:alkylation response protein AidB-like acyl-CoA dehydrogenase